MRLRRSNIAHAPVAATVTAFSTYLIGLCILLSLSSTWELELSPRSPKGTCVIRRSTKKPGSSMRGMVHRDAIESARFRHAEGNEGKKIAVKRGNGGFDGCKLLKRQGRDSY